MIISRIDKRDILFMLLIVVCALSFRVLYFIDYKKLIVYPVLAGSDGYNYYEWAKDIVYGGFIPEAVFMKWPLYAYFLAFLIFFFGENFFLIYWLQFILGISNCLLVYLIARRLFNRTVAVLSGSLCVFYGLFIFYEGILIYTALSLFLNSLFFLSVLYLKNNPTLTRSFLTGIFLGISTITQPHIAIFGILALIYILILKKNKRLFLKAYGIFLAGFFLVIASVTYISYLAEKDLVLLYGNSGFNFYLGNNRNATGIFYCPPTISANQRSMFRDSRIIAEQALGRYLKTEEVSRYWFGKSLDFIREQPGKFLVLLTKKIQLVFSTREFISDNEYPYLAGKIKIFKVMLMDLRLLLPAAVFGMFFALKRVRETLLLYLVYFSLSLSISLFFVAARYRISAVPFLIIFSAYGVFKIAALLKERKFIKFGAFCAGLIAFGILLNYTSSSQAKTLNARSPVSRHLYSAMHYQMKEDYKTEIRELKRAYSLEPRNQFILFSLGFAYYKLEDLKMAQVLFKEAIQLNPLFVDAYYNLGYLYNSQKEFGKAQKMLQIAVSLDPRNLEAHLELAKTYKLLGNKAGARQELHSALRRLRKRQYPERAWIEKEIASLLSQ